MKHFELSEMILAAFVNTPSQETFKRKMEMIYPRLNNFQFEILSEQLKSYQSFGERETLFLFPWILNNIRSVHPHLTQKQLSQTLWDRGFKSELESVEKVEQMYCSWIALEKKLIEIEKEHAIDQELER